MRSNQRRFGNKISICQGHNPETHRAEGHNSASPQIAQLGGLASFHSRHCQVRQTPTSLFIRWLSETDLQSFDPLCYNDAGRLLLNTAMNSFLPQLQPAKTWTILDGFRVWQAGLLVERWDDVDEVCPGVIQFFSIAGYTDGTGSRSTTDRSLVRTSTGRWLCRPSATRPL